MMLIPREDEACLPISVLVGVQLELVHAIQLRFVWRGKCKAPLESHFHTPAAIGKAAHKKLTKATIKVA